MKIPEGWKLVPIEPTEEMCRAAEESDHGSSSRPWFDGMHTPENVEGLYKAMLAAAPTPPEEVQMKKNGNAASPNQNIVAIFTAILSALEQQPLGADFEKVLYDNLSEINESNTPAQEDEPVAEVIDGEVIWLSSPGEVKDGELLYTRPQSDNLRKAAEETVAAFDKQIAGPLPGWIEESIEKLRAELKGES